MLGRKIGEDERVELDMLVAELRRALRGHLDYCPFAFRIDCLAQEFLHEHAPRHRHLVEIAAALRADLEAERVGERGRVASLFENSIHKFRRRRLSLGTGHSDDFDRAGRMLVFDRSEPGHETMIYRRGLLEEGRGNEHFDRAEKGIHGFNSSRFS